MPVVRLRGTNLADAEPMVRCLQPASEVFQLCVESWSVRFLTTARQGGQERSGRFDFVSFDAHGKRSLDCIHGNHERAVSIARDQYAFQTIKHAAPDSHALTNLEEGMRRPGQLRFNHTPNRIDLLIGNGCAFALRADEAKYSVHAQNAQSVRLDWV